MFMKHLSKLSRRICKFLKLKDFVISPFHRGGNFLAPRTVLKGKKIILIWANSKSLG